MPWWGWAIVICLLVAMVLPEDKKKEPRDDLEWIDRLEELSALIDDEDEW